jgi:hypothetical protein
MKISITIDVSYKELKQLVIECLEFNKEHYGKIYLDRSWRHIRRGWINQSLKHELNSGRQFPSFNQK